MRVNMDRKILRIKWQRLINEEGKTCKRCRSTGKEIEKAVKALRAALAHVGFNVRLEKDKLSGREFKRKPHESNRIWVAKKPLEDWLDAQTGKSGCCDTCEGEECRTVRVGSKTYVVIPTNLVIQAGLLAAADLMRPKKGPPTKGMRKNRVCCQ